MTTLSLQIDQAALANPKMHQVPLEMTKMFALQETKDKPKIVQQIQK